MKSEGRIKVIGLTTWLLSRPVSQEIAQIAFDAR
jgi:hypothetical protein